MPAASSPSNRQLKNRLDCVIWDMDGVLIDSMEYQFEVWQSIFAEYGVVFDRANFNRHFGTTNLQTIQKTLGDRITLEEAVALAERMERSLIHPNMEPYSFDEAMLFAEDLLINNPMDIIALE